MRASLLKHGIPFSAAFLLSGSIAATAQTAIVNSGQCYSRTYDAAHLASHPRQKVRAIRLRKLDGASAGKIAPGKIALLIGFTLRGHKVQFQAYAECRAAGANLVCDMEGDAGGFDLTPARNDGLRIRVTRQMGVEGDTMIEFGGKISDDNIFILNSVRPGACALLKAP